MPKPFLRQVAEQYLLNETASTLADYCFVFPNRRSCKFFSMYLQQILEEQTQEDTFVFPALTTIQDLNRETTNMLECSRLEQQFILYHEYEQITPEKGRMSFDKFVFYGDMIINDFNDVDNNLADAKKLFSNVKDLKELNSYYLTEEQERVLQEYLPNYYPSTVDAHNGDDFWRHIHHTEESETDSPQTRFVRLWEILYDLYVHFNKALDERHMAYSGKMARQTAKIFSSLSADELAYKRYIFVGFNAITFAEISLFSSLQRLNAADYYWDDYSPIISQKEHHCGYFINQFKRKFKSLYELEKYDESDSQSKPTLDICAVPSAAGQVKHINHLLKQYHKELTATDLSSVIVLPDEQTIMPMLNSIPEEYTDINLTLGLTMRTTEVANIISSIKLLFKHAQPPKSDGESWHFLHTDVKNLLSHEICITNSHGESLPVLDEITKQNLFLIPTDWLKERFKDTIAPLFCTDIKANNRPKDILAYFSALIKYLSAVYTEQKRPIEYMAIEKLQDNIMLVASSVEQYQIKGIEGETFLYLFERLFNSEKLICEGEPLKGLQIMGTLETRNLDFKNIFIVSVNERILPKRHRSRSFIPNMIRRAFGLPTAQHQENIAAFYFYRLISRAETVHLLYDSRASNTSSGEQSRFIYQLLYLYNDCFKKITRQTLSYNVKSSQLGDISFAIDRQMLEPYLDEAQLSENHFSPSSLKIYLQCPLRFYLAQIKRLYEDEPKQLWLESDEFGTIFHNTMCDIYRHFFRSGKVQDDMLKVILNQLTVQSGKYYEQLSDLLVCNINKVYRAQRDCHSLKETDRIYFSIILQYIINTLSVDCKLGDFEIVSMEEKVEVNWHGVNFRFYIDRVDCVDGRLRIIDYKTGSDDTRFDDVASLFDSESKKKLGGVFQVILYCHLYAHKYHLAEGTPITPIIYKIRDFNRQTTMVNIEYGSGRSKTALTDYNDISQEFLQHIENTIFQPLFGQPQCQIYSKATDHCQYCQFKAVCQK